MGAASNDNSLVALDVQKSYEQGLDIFAMTLNGLLLAAYTLSPGQNLLEFPGLPAGMFVTFNLKECILLIPKLLYPASRGVIQVI